MSVSKKKKSSSKSKRGRSHQALTPKKFIDCSKCGTKKMPHTVCPNCGTYKGKEILKPKAKKQLKNK